MTPHPNFDVMKFVKKLRKDVRRHTVAEKLSMKKKNYMESVTHGAHRVNTKCIADQLETYAKTGEVK